MAPDALFVYGTLKEGFCNFRKVAPLVSRVLKNWEVAGVLFDVGEYPGLRPGGECRVKGELLESENLRELLRFTDEIEAGEYDRVSVTALSEGGTTRTVWTYRYLGDTSGLRQLPLGEWTG